MADRSKVEELITEQLNAIDADHGDKWEIGSVVCVVEAKTDEGTEVRVRFAGDGDPTTAYGLLKLAERGFLENMEIESNVQEPDDAPESPSEPA